MKISSTKYCLWAVLLPPLLSTALLQTSCGAESQPFNVASFASTGLAVGTGRGLLARKAGCSSAIAGGNSLGDKVAVPQVGWAPWAPKVAVYATSSWLEAPAFTLSLDGQSVMQGQAQPGGARWGMFTHTIDLSHITQEGVYALHVDGAPDTCIEIRAEAYQAVRGGDALTTHSLADLLGAASFFAYQRCGTPGDILRNPDDGDRGLPLYRIGSGGRLTPVKGATGDVSGGWHNATSTDKELVTHARALENLVYALEQIHDPADERALLDEIVWGAAYLLKVQNADGSWYLSIHPAVPERTRPPSKGIKPPPRRQEINVDTGSVARAAAALAAVAKATQARLPALATQARRAAGRADTWVRAHPDQFVTDNVVFAGHHGNATGVLDLAINMALLDPSQERVDYANHLVLAGTITPWGMWNKISGRFPGQHDFYEVEDSQAVVPLLRYYPMAPADVRAHITIQAHAWLHFLQAQQDPTWGINQAHLHASFGGNGALTLDTAGLLLMYQTLGTQVARDYAQNNMDWVWGRNPFGMSFVPGLGREIGVPPFLRPLANSYGAVLPGIKTTIDGGRLQISTDFAKDAWEVGEATIDASSTLLWVLAMLQNTQPL